MEMIISKSGFTPPSPRRHVGPHEKGGRRVRRGEGDGRNPFAEPEGRFLNSSPRKVTRGVLILPFHLACKPLFSLVSVGSPLVPLVQSGLFADER